MGSDLSKSDPLLVGLSQGVAPVMHLRDMNPYVGNALSDWKKQHHLHASIPLGMRSQAELLAAGAPMSTSNSHVTQCTQCILHHKRTFP